MAFLFRLEHLAICGVFAVLATGLGASQTEAADRLVLRNLQVVADRQVTSFDEDGMVLDDGRRLTWDVVERGTLGAARQPAFDRLLKELGDPLFRVRQRLKVGDYAGAATPAEQVYARYFGRRGDSAYMVVQAVMWGRLAEDRREAAVEPFLLCCEQLRGKKPADVVLPGERRLTVDAAAGLSPELPPVWFDPLASRAAMPGVLKAVATMREPRPPGARVHYATLALAAGHPETAIKALRGIPDDAPLAAELRAVVLVQHELVVRSNAATAPAASKLEPTPPGPAVIALEEKFERLHPWNRPLAIYWLGRVGLLTADADARRDAVLRLLHLPALHGTDSPELAAAALYEAIVALEAMNDRPAAQTLRKELAQRFGRTTHAARLAEE